MSVIRILLTIALAILFNAAAAAPLKASSEETALADSLFDLKALVVAEIGYAGFSERLPDLVVQLDRMKRKGTASADLESAVEHYRAAQAYWLTLNRLKGNFVNGIAEDFGQADRDLLALRQKYLDDELGAAAEALSHYQRTSAANAAKSPKR